MRYLELPLDEVVVEGQSVLDNEFLPSLIESVRQLGLLSPIGVSPEHRLLYGAHRLAAARHVGLSQLPAVVIETALDHLDYLRIERDENLIRRRVPVTEEVALYRQILKIEESAARRRIEDAASVGGQVKAGSAPAKVSQGQAPRRAKSEASKAATGVVGRHKTLEKAAEIVDLAADTATPEPVRQVVADALAEMDETGKVDAAYKKVKASITAADYIAKYPDLAHYRANGKRVADIGQRLDAYTPTERSTRLENLRKVIAAELRREAEPPEPAAPDYYAMTDAIFVVANRLAQVIDKEGGAATVAAAIPRADPVMSRTWHEQFASLATTLSALADATQPKLRSIR